MKQSYMIIDETRYEQGTIFVIKHHNGIGFVEQRNIFLYYDPVESRYYFITPTPSNADLVTIYPDTRFMNSLIQIDTPAEKEKHILKNHLSNDQPQNTPTTMHISKTNKSSLFIIGLIILYALLPPVGIIVYLCIIFSDGKPSGFLGCLTPFLVFGAIAWIYMIFTQFAL